MQYNNNINKTILNPADEKYCMRLQDICYHYSNNNIDNKSKWNNKIHCRHSVIGLEHINLLLKPKQLVAIIGESGCGKSTLLRLIAGLLPAQAGCIQFADLANNHMVLHDQSTKKDVAMVFQNHALIPWLTVLDNAAMGLGQRFKSLAHSHKKHILRLLEMAGLNNSLMSYPPQLSGGMCQRLGFARALASQPRLLLLDEAFSSLDYMTAKRLRYDFMDYWYNGKHAIEAVLMVTHNIQEAIDLADRVIILGRVKNNTFFRDDNHTSTPADSEYLATTIIHDMCLDEQHYRDLTPQQIEQNILRLLNQAI